MEKKDWSIADAVRRVAYANDDLDSRMDDLSWDNEELWFTTGWRLPEDHGHLPEGEDLGRLREVDDLSRLPEGEDLGHLPEVDYLGRLQEGEELGRLPEVDDHGHLPEGEGFDRLPEVDDLGRLPDVEDLSCLPVVEDLGRQESSFLEEWKTKTAISLQPSRDSPTQTTSLSRGRMRCPWIMKICCCLLRVSARNRQCD